MRRDLLLIERPLQPSLSRTSWEKGMSLSRKRAPTNVLKTDHLRGAHGSASCSPGRRLKDFLRRRHPFKTAAHAAAEAGVSLAAIDRMLEREATPSFGTLGRLLAAYGPALLAETMDEPPEWLREAAHREAHERRDV